MLRFFKIICLAFTLTTPTLVFSQSDIATANLVEKILESVADNDTENLDYTNLLDAVETLVNNPIAINTATAEKLEELYLFNDYQVKSLIKYRKNNGAFFSIYELQLVPGFSPDFVQSIAPLIQINPIIESATQKRYSRQMLLLKSEANLQKENAYNVADDSSRYLGNAWKYYTRYQYVNNGGITAGFTAEKDKGEPFFTDNNKYGFDYYSAHIQLKRKGFIQQVNVGDYQVKFGEGVSLWSGLGGGKSSFTTQNIRKRQGISAYKSTNENLFFRGIATILKPIKNGNLALFASAKKIDATIDTTTNFVSGIVNTGLHRNKKEFAKKHQIKEKIFGAYFTINLPQIKAGLSFINYNYSSPLADRNQPYAYYNFSGTSNYNISFSYKSVVRNITLYGEIARSKSGGLGILQGANFQLHPQISIEGIYRNYAKNYHARYAMAFGERGENRNERGFYLGTTIHPLPKWSIKAYYDQYEFPWLTYQIASPSSGHDYFAEVSFSPTNSVSVYFRYKQENRPENYSSTPTKNSAEVQKNQYRLHLSSQPASHWQLRNRLEFSTFKKQQKTERGFLIYQDVIYKFSQLPLQIGVRYAIFDTDTYNTRIYAYENDVLYGYSIPAYYDKGTRFYINLRYQPCKKVVVYCRYAQTKYANKNSIGSGLSTINGNTKSDIKLQIKIAL